MLILKIKTFLIHVPGSHVRGNISFYYGHGASYIVGVCASGISTKIFRKVYVWGKS